MHDPDELRRIMEERIPFNRVLGIRVAELAPGFARLEIPYREELIGDQQRPALHGGVISALVDTCAGTACWTEIEAGDRVSTVDLRVDYLRPGRRETLVAEARVIRMGNRVAVADVTVFHPDAPGELVASGKAVYNVARRQD